MFVGVSPVYIYICWAYMMPVSAYVCVGRSLSVCEFMGVWCSSGVVDAPWCLFEVLARQSQFGTDRESTPVERYKFKWVASWGRVRSYRINRAYSKSQVKTKPTPLLRVWAGHLCPIPEPRGGANLEDCVVSLIGPGHHDVNTLHFLRQTSDWFIGKLLMYLLNWPQTGC